MLKKGKYYYPTKEFKKRAWLNKNSIYKKAAKNPVLFWEKLAKEIYWRKKWKKAFEHTPPYFKWFVGGKLNITENCLDKNLDYNLPTASSRQRRAPRKNKVALIWEPEPIEERARYLTYYDLYRQVNKFANALKKLGVKKGDRVGIYLPMIPEVVISMLACARIGAVHTVVFSAFSPSALKIRLQDTEAKILITADGYYRRGEIINLKKNADEGIKDTKVKKVIVVKRAKNEIPWNKKGDTWYEDLIKNEKDFCEAEVMDSEDLLFILYTSGCCHKETLIQLENGEIKKISELVEKGGSNLINVNLNELKQNSDPIINKYKYYWPLQLLEIQTPLSTIKVTQNHPFFVLQDNGTFIEKEAKDLQGGDHILQVTKIKIKGQKQRLPHPKIKYDQEKCNRLHLSNKPTIPNFLTPTFAQILGYLTGDGGVTDSQIRITDKDKRNLIFYKSLFEKELKVRCQIKKYSRQNLVINSAFLARYLNTVFPEIFIDSNWRKIPLKIQKTTQKCIASFIRGLFDAEGSVTGGAIKITTQSKELIQALQILLLRFGIIANYFEEERKTHFGKRYYEILVPGLRITNRESLEIFKEKISFSSKAKMQKLNELLEDLKNKKKASMIHQLPINGLARRFRKTIMLPKKECRAIHLDSYIYSNRRIKRVRLPKIRRYLQQKINLIRFLNLSGRKKLNSKIRSEIKTAIRLFKVSQKKIAKISGKTPETVHQYLNRKNPIVSEKFLNKFYKTLLPYLFQLKKEKLKILREILDKIKKLENLKDVGFFEIKEIKKVNNDFNFVYDLTALKNHNYIANSFVVHNSTGKPKGTTHVCGGYTVQAYWTGKWIFDLRDEDIFWSTADVGWVTGHTYGVYSPLLNGVTSIMYEGAPDFPTPERWAQIIEKYKVTTFYTAPTAIRMFEKYNGKIAKKYKFDSLQILGSVGEPIDESAWQWYFKEVGKGRCPIVDTWWQTETGGILITSLPGVGPFRPAFAGLSFPGTKFGILDENGKSLGPNKEGNLVLFPPFAPGLLRGVYKNPKKYLKTYWSQHGKKIYFTSDAALKDKNSLIRIVGRVDDVIKVAGHRLTTGELEAAINLHEDITECAVVGIPNEIKGEVPVAFIVLRKKRIFEQIKKETKSQVMKEIGPIALPKEVYLVRDLPKTRSGKIVRRILKRILRDEELGDLTTLANPESITEIRQILGKPGKQ